MHVPETRLIVPDSPALIEATRVIFREYAASLAVDLSFQDFEQELRDLPGNMPGPTAACCWRWWMVRWQDVAPTVPSRMSTTRTPAR